MNEIHLMRSQIRNYWKLLLLAIAAFFVTGCASTRLAVRETFKQYTQTLHQYSIDSYEGPFPLRDQHYIEGPRP